MKIILLSLLIILFSCSPIKKANKWLDGISEYNIKHLKIDSRGMLYTYYTNNNQYTKILFHREVMIYINCSTNSNRVNWVKRHYPKELHQRTHNE